MYYYYYENNQILEINVSKQLWHNIKVNINSMMLSKIWGCPSPPSTLKIIPMSRSLEESIDINFIKNDSLIVQSLKDKQTKKH